MIYGPRVRGYFSNCNLWGHLDKVGGFFGFRPATIMGKQLKLCENSASFRLGTFARMQIKLKHFLDDNTKLTLLGSAGTYVIVIASPENNAHSVLEWLGFESDLGSEFVCSGWIGMLESSLVSPTSTRPHIYLIRFYGCCVDVAVL